MQTSVHLYPAHIKAGTVRRDLQKMLGEAQWTMACPRVPALLLLVVVGTLQAPLLYLYTSRAQEGEVVLARCVLQMLVPAARIVFCKDGMEVYSMKAHQHTVIYSMLMNISARSSGTYTCVYQQRNESNWLRRSPLSTPLDLHVTGHVSRSMEETAHADSYTPLGPIVIAVAPVAVTLLLSAASCWIIKKVLRDLLPTTILTRMPMGAFVLVAGEGVSPADGWALIQDLPADANVDEMRRVKVSCALAEACRLSVHFFVCRRHGFGGEMPAQLSRWRCSGCSSPPATFPWGMLHGRAVGPL
ncbi:uncharacterized protein LOC112531053 isoform X7 [Gallus gallus]|uniref:uncharacterized protein LOC112531053 isoform X7 n=1 Tax=Gallus gallus TaxID=9031 RepID=UPI001AEA6CD6|nr:uncharacterized protein LOC112531053 isoform X7 [Gallus gallus]